MKKERNRIILITVCKIDNVYVLSLIYNWAITNINLHRKHKCAPIMINNKDNVFIMKLITGWYKPLNHGKKVINNKYDTPPSYDECHVYVF